MRSESEDRGRALRDVGHHDHEPAGRGLRHPGQPHGNFPISARRAQQKVQVEARIRPVEKLGEQGRTVWIDLVDHDDEAAAVPGLVCLDQFLPQVARLMLGT